MSIKKTIAIIGVGLRAEECIEKAAGSLETTGRNGLKDMFRNMRPRVLGLIYAASFLILITVEINSAQADLNLGKRYDQKNYQEIQELLFPALLNWVKKGEVVLQTGGLEFEWKKSKAFLDASLKNEGKYDIDKDGLLIEKGTGKPPQLIYGYPFLKIDPKDPKAGEKILENRAAQLFSLGSYNVTGQTMWISGGGRVERQVTAFVSYLFYQQRREELIPNPDNFLFQRISCVIEPFDLRGMNSLFWSYNDRREDTAFVYIPRIWRARRVSTSDPSSPFLGSDRSYDDVNLWSGKNASMKWKLIGSKTLLMPFTSAKKIEVKEFQDGSIDREFVNVKMGLEVPGWKGALWCPVDVVWSPRPCWIVEMNSKYSNYFYGKQVLYIDKEAYMGLFKEIYNKDGQYWKTQFLLSSYQVTSTGKDLVGITDFVVMVDDKTRHSTVVLPIAHPSRDHRMNLPLSVLGPKDFTEDAFIQLSK